MHRTIILFVIALSIFSCSRTTLLNKGEIFYANIWEDDYIVDSLLFYNGHPSFEVYRHLDSVKKQVDQTAYLETFKIGKHKFGIIADSAYTRFYKYHNKHFTQIDSMAVGIGWAVETRLQDLNHDGYNDVIYTIVSGGFHGADNFILFYDPAKKTLLRDRSEIVNLDIDGDTLLSKYRMFQQKYVVRGMKLQLLEEAGYDEDIQSRIVKKFDEKGTIIAIDTLRVNDEEEVVD